MCGACGPLAMAAAASGSLVLEHEGLFVGELQHRLTNTRYADDIILYAKSSSELVAMTKKFISELEKIQVKESHTYYSYRECITSHLSFTWVVH